MSKRVPQSKRLQVIQKWLNGRDDEEYEVFPTKTEGKYIVRPRKEPLNKPPVEPQSEPAATEPQEEEPTVESTEEPPVKPLPLALQRGSALQPKKITRTKSQAQSPQIYSRSEVGFANEAASTRCLRQAEDPTINIEILNQLKLLGEEFKNERAKKEQKKMIKEVVQKQMRKPYYQYTQPQYIQEPNDIEEPEEPAPPPPQIQPQPIRRRRNNIFSDMC